MPYRLFAFDLDGTLLDDKKQLSQANLNALHEISAAGAAIVFATGRLASSVDKYLPAGLERFSLLALNGAEVWSGVGKGANRIRFAPLSVEASDCLIRHGQGRDFAVNYYREGDLYTVKNERTAPWVDLYYQQTSSHYRFVPSLDRFLGMQPSKIIFVGAPPVMDEQERFFREKWGDSVYICRTWDYYLEFLDPKANKASGLEALLEFYGIAWPEVAAFGDAENDIPMLRKAGLGVAMANAEEAVKKAAKKTCRWTNNEDGIAREWEEIRKAGEGRSERGEGKEGKQEFLY